MKYYKVILLLLLVGCASYTERIADPNMDIDVFFCPKNNCILKMQEEISSAEESVYCAFYELKSQKLIDQIKKQSGLVKTGIVLHKEENYGLMHNKFCIIDGKEVITGSFNPTDNKNRNNLVVISSKYIAQNYMEEYIELAGNKLGTGKKTKTPKVASNSMVIESYFCPEDNCRQVLINEILNAKTSIDFMVFSFTDESVGDALLYSNAEIGGIFDRLQASSKYSQFTRLKEFNLDVKTDSLPGFLHHKVFIIDHNTVITGSYNPTLAGNFQNDENMLVIRSKSVAEKFMSEFNELFSQK